MESGAHTDPVVEAANTEQRCNFCGGPFVAHDRAWCSLCGQPFHLALRTDVPVTDCGQAWIDEQVEAVCFGCNRCLQAASHENTIHIT